MQRPNLSLKVIHVLIKLFKTRAQSVNQLARYPRQFIHIGTQMPVPKEVSVAYTNPDTPNSRRLKILRKALRC